MGYPCGFDLLRSHEAMIISSLLASIRNVPSGLSRECILLVHQIQKGSAPRISFMEFIGDD